MTKPRKRVLKTTFLPREPRDGRGGTRPGADRPRVLTWEEELMIGIKFDEMRLQDIEDAKTAARASVKPKLAGVREVLDDQKKMHLKLFPRSRKSHTKWSQLTAVQHKQDDLTKALASAKVPRHYQIGPFRESYLRIARRIQLSIIDEGGPNVSISTVMRSLETYFERTEDTDK